MKAIGMIETKGLVPAIESADAMLKAAEVTLIERRFVKGGLVTIVIAGDVAACKASVDAAASAVQRMGGEIVSTHVIPRPHSTLSGLIVNRIPGDDEEISDPDDEESHISSRNIENEGGGTPSEPVEEAEEHAENTTEEPAGIEETGESRTVEIPENLHKAELDEIVEAKGADAVREILSGKKVVELRTLAREYNGQFGISGREITHSNKSALIDQFEEYYKK